MAKELPRGEKLYIDADIGNEAEIPRMKTYVFADRFVVPKLKRALNTHIVGRGFYCWPMFEIFIYAFDNLPHDDVMLSFLVDCHVMNWYGPKDIEDNQLTLQ